jgi:alpha-L-rhamnosidase
VLSTSGYLDSAYALLKQTSWPSWLYAVTQGATTIWERWDGWTRENGFQTPNMNSFNHYAYGAIGSWMYNTIAGIDFDPAAPGYKHAILRPQPGGALTFACAALDTLYGRLVSDWKLENDVFEYSVTVPPNTSATVYLPFSGNTALNGKGIDGVVHELTAGTYHFVVER